MGKRRFARPDEHPPEPPPTNPVPPQAPAASAPPQALPALVLTFSVDRSTGRLSLASNIGQGPDPASDLALAISGAEYVTAQLRAEQLRLAEERGKASAAAGAQTAGVPAKG